MADQGMHTLDELVGRSDLLEKDDNGLSWKQQTIDISAILDEPEPLVYSDYKPKSVLDKAMDAQTAKGNMRGRAGKRPTCDCRSGDTQRQPRGGHIPRFAGMQKVR